MQLFKKINISAFFPAHNEEKNIRQLTDILIDVLDEVANNYEIIIVNDGSTDRTGKVARELCGKYPFIKLVEHKKNLGYGAAIKSGLRAAKYEWIFFTDGDNQFDVEEIKNFLPHINDYKIVIGYRLKRQDIFFRRLNAWAWKKLMGFLFPELKGIKDIDCAFKLLKKELIVKIELTTSGAMISAELLLKIIKNGNRVKQIGVHHCPRKIGEQSGASIKVICRAFKELFMFYRKFR